MRETKTSENLLGVLYIYGFCLGIEKRLKKKNIFPHIQRRAQWEIWLEDLFNQINQYENQRKYVGWPGFWVLQWLLLIEYEYSVSNLISYTHMENR